MVLPPGFGQTPTTAEERAAYNAAADVGMRKLLELSKKDAPGFSHVRARVRTRAVGAGAASGVRLPPRCV